MLFGTEGEVRRFNEFLRLLGSWILRLDLLLVISIHLVKRLRDREGLNVKKKR